MRAIRIHEHGGPEVLKFEEVPTPTPRPGQVLVRNTAIGVNFIDTYHRKGLYKIPLPGILGQEAAGVVEAVGEGVTTLKPGARVAFLAPLVCYAEYTVLDADRALVLPDSVSDEVAAAGLLKGLTVQALIRSTHKVQKGETIVWHAAAGGVGQIATQWAAHLGATVIGVVGSDEKAAIAKRKGCVHTLVLPRDNLVESVRALTGGEGVPVVYDSVGKDTFMASLDCLAPLGMMVTFGNASGPPPDINPLILAQKGSLFLTRPTQSTYTRTPALLKASAEDFFAVLASGAVKIDPPKRYALADAAQAHSDLEGRKTTGSLILVP
jgi:NADPH2:quinone reductase